MRRAAERGRRRGKGEKEGGGEEGSGEAGGAAAINPRRRLRNEITAKMQGHFTAAADDDDGLGVG